MIVVFDQRAPLPAYFFFMTSSDLICVVALLCTSAMVSTLSRKRDSLKDWNATPSKMLPQTSCYSENLS